MAGRRCSSPSVLQQAVEAVVGRRPRHMLFETETHDDSRVRPLKMSAVGLLGLLRLEEIVEVSTSSKPLGSGLASQSS